MTPQYKMSSKFDVTITDKSGEFDVTIKGQYRPTQIIRAKYDVIVIMRSNFDGTISGQNYTSQ